MKTAVAHISNLTPNGLVAKAIFVRLKMTGNAAFPTPPVTMPALDTATKDVENAAAVAADGGHSAHVDLNLKVVILANILVGLAAYVTVAAHGDEVLILSAGFDVRKKREPVGELPAPHGLSVKATDKPGRLVARWKPESGAYMYQVFMNVADPNDETKWLPVDSTSRAHYTFDGLTTGKTVWIRVNSMGAAGTSPMSDPAKGVPV